MSSEVSQNEGQCPSCGHRGVPGDKFCSECGGPMTVEAHPDPLIGKMLPGGYRISEFIAEGSMGRVYRAEQANLGRSVAVKIMNSALLSHPSMVERFRTEARAASMLTHPNCMRVYDFGETPDKRPYLVMELLHGQDLELILRDEPLLPIPRVFDITLQVLRALEEAHSQGIVHRDLKPANVFVMPQRTGGEVVKVVDFGLAKLRSAVSGSNMTMTGTICGTPAYMAPEQATGSETDARADLYAVGIMLYEMIAGRPPFASDEPTVLLRNHVFDDPPPIAPIAGDRLIPGVEAIVMRALEKKPKDRFENAAAFSLKIQELLAIRGVERERGLVRTPLRACSDCGGLFPATSRFCGDCGAPAPRESIPQVHDGMPAGQTPVLSPPEAEPTSSPPRDITGPMRVTSQSAVRVAVDDREDGPSTYRMSWGREETGPRPRFDPRADEDSSSTPSKPVRTGASPPPARPLSAQPNLRTPASGRRKPLPTLDEEGTAAALGTRESDIPGETAATLVHLERVAARRAEAGDHQGAIAALKRAVIHIKNDIDRGELDDPIGAMTLFTGKLGEALLAAGEASEALESLREAVSLMKPGAERVRLLLVMGRAAREIGRDDEARRYLDEAEAEAESRVAEHAGDDKRSESGGLSQPPEDRASGVNLSRGVDTPAPSRRRSM